MFDFILLSIIGVLYLVGFSFLIINVIKLNNRKNKAKDESELPVYIKRSFSYILLAFFLMILVNLF
jgi:L-asparagine transporter-like permease